MRFRQREALINHPMGVQYIFHYMIDDIYYSRLTRSECYRNPSLLLPLIEIETWMVTDQQVRRLFTYMNKENTLATAAAKAGLGGRFGPEYSKKKALKFYASESKTMSVFGWRGSELPQNH